MATPVADPWWSPFARIGDVEVLCLDLAPNASREAEAIRWLDEAERERCDRYVNEAARRRFALSRAAIRIALCERLSCDNDELEFDTPEYGKPKAYVDGVRAPLNFSISHSDRYGLIAISGSGPVGIDIEELSQKLRFDAIIESAFSPNERALVDNIDEAALPRTFFEIWTLKEAVIKATGTGMYANLPGIEAPPDMRNGAVSGLLRLPEFPDVCWRLHKLSGDGFVGALAVEAVPSSLDEDALT